MSPDTAVDPVPSAAPAPRGQGPGRLALLTTPRAGNNWLRRLLGVLYAMPTQSVHTPEDVDWDDLPEDWLFGIHWHPTPSFLERLRRHGFRVVVLARHPLDVLISVLQFCWRSDSTGRWLEGEGGDEGALWGAMPRSAPFLRYAAGPRAAALLSVSREWWGVHGSLTVRYEDLVADSLGTLEGLVQAIGGRPRKAPEEALRAVTLPALRATTGCRHHFWQGKPGLWRTLLPAAEAEGLTPALAPALAEFGYVCDPDPRLTPAEADENWIRLVGKDLVDDLRRLESSQGELVEARALLADRDEALRQAAAERDWQRKTLTHRTEEVEWRRQIQDQQAAELEWRRTVEDQQAAELEWRRTVEDHQAAELEWRRKIQADLEAQLADLQGANAALHEEVARLRLRTAPLEGQTLSALQIAWRLQGLTAEGPQPAVVRRVLRLTAHRAGTPSP